MSWAIGEEIEVNPKPEIPDWVPGDWFKVDEHCEKSRMYFVSGFQIYLMEPRRNGVIVNILEAEG